MPNLLTRSLRAGSRALPFHSLLLASLLGTACSGAPGDGESSAEQEIINGTSLGAGSSGIVRLSAAGQSCTGTLLRNDAVLTARHCTTLDQTTFGPVNDDVGHYFFTMGNQSSTGVEVIRHPTLDVALVITSRFVAMNGSNVDWQFPIFSGTNSSLLGSTLRCAGYGNNTLTGGAGSLRQADLRVSSTTTTNLVYAPNASGQIMWSGDSGGTCTTMSGTPEVTGVNSSCASSGGVVQRCTQVGPQAYRTWALDNLAARAEGFVHTTTSTNVSFNWTQLAESNPNAIVHVTPNWNPNGGPGRYLQKNIGVWFNGAIGRWAIFTQDQSPMPVGASFNVSVGGGFVHRATTANIVSSLTKLDDPALNGNPNAIFTVTPNWNPGGAGGTYDDHPIAVFFDSNFNKWVVFNQDFAAMPVGAAFNVRPGTGTAHFVHEVTVANSNSSDLDQPDINGVPNATVFVTTNTNPGGGAPVFNPHPIGVWFNATTNRWAIFNQDFGLLPVGATFNVMVRP